MAITDINISEQLETDAPSIKYTGNEGPQNPQQQQQQQEIQIAKQIWEALGPEQQGQFQSFEQFFQSGVWKQILQQMQADEGQGPGPQGPGPQGPGPQGPGPQGGIAGLGPESMQQQTPMPNRMGAEYGGRMGYQGGEIVEKIKEKIIEGGDRARGLPGIDESIWIEKLLEHLKKKRGEGRPDPRGEITQEEIIEQLRPRDPGEQLRPRRPYEEEIGIESLRGRP